MRLLWECLGRKSKESRKGLVLRCLAPTSRKLQCGRESKSVLRRRTVHCVPHQNPSIILAAICTTVPLILFLRFCYCPSLHHSEIGSPLSFPLMSHLPYNKFELAIYSPLHSGILSEMTHIILPEQIAHHGRYKAGVHERDECCSRCPAEVAPAILVQLCDVGICQNSKGIWEIRMG